MIEGFIILFRETLEASLVIGIVIATFKRQGIKDFHGTVYSAILLAILSSIAGAFLFDRLAGGFTGKGEQIFEGLVMIVSAVLLTTMIIWMLKNSNQGRELRRKLNERISSTYKLGVFFLVFTAILREGIEAVLFLSAANFATGNNNLTGALLGMAAAVAFSILFLAGTWRLNIRVFFTVINITLILFASGLFSSGIHELQEAGWIPVLREDVFNINPPVLPDGSYPLLHEKGYIGSIAKGLFGYNGNPSLLELAGYAFYIVSASFAWLKISRIEKKRLSGS